jgi:hypothetical protein
VLCHAFGRLLTPDGRVKHVDGVLKATVTAQQLGQRPGRAGAVLVGEGAEGIHRLRQPVPTLEKIRQPTGDPLPLLGHQCPQLRFAAAVAQQVGQVVDMFGRSWAGCQQSGSGRGYGYLAALSR